MQNRYGETCLHAACGKGNYSAVECLLKNGANVNVLNFAGENACHKVIMSGKTDVSLKIVQLLIEYGCDLSTCGLQGTPVTLAISLGVPNSLISYLQEKVAEQKTKGIKSKPVDRSGPSYDCIDFATLLGMRKTQTNSSV